MDLPDDGTLALMKFGIEEVPPSNPWLAKTLELVSRHDVTFYDAAYHSIALVHGGVFVTADSRYLSHLADSRAVIALADWQPPQTPSRRNKQ